MSLKTKATAAVDAPTNAEDVTVSTFAHSSKDMHVRVEKPAAGYLCTLSMVARVPLPPDQLYEMLVNPDECKRIFKTLKHVHHRRVIAEDAQGNRTVEVDQTGSWRFLMFRGTFTVRMIVEQRRQERAIHFRLARPGFMKDFSGTWLVRPYDNAALDQLVNRHTPTPLHRLQSGLRAMEQSLGLGSQQPESLVQLRQSIAPALAPPAGVAKLLQRIAAKQITKIMSDLQDEAQRLNSTGSAGTAHLTSSSSSSGSASSSRKLLAAAAAADTVEEPATGSPSKQDGRKQRRRRGRRQEVEEAAEEKKQLRAHVSDLQ